MQCPLCAGPLRLREPDRFACQRGHTLTTDELETAAATRITVAFWMAIEALETEADVLRTLGVNVDRRLELADQAQRDADVLRELAMSHLELATPEMVDRHPPQP